MTCSARDLVRLRHEVRAAAVVGGSLAAVENPF